MKSKIIQLAVIAVGFLATNMVYALPFFIFPTS